MASQLNFNNATSVSVSYAWDNGQNTRDNLPLAALCSGNPLTVGDDEWVRRTKTVSVQTLDVDLQNPGGGIASNANNQQTYTAGGPATIKVGDLDLGEGNLKEQSMTEGSQANQIQTNLTFDMTNGGPDPQTGTTGQTTQYTNTNQLVPDPVNRSEVITVSRDLVSKSYTIQHNASVSYGSDFDLISNHPLYSGNTNYQSANGRLQLATNTVNQAVNNPVDYVDYIPALSKYVSKKGWNLKKIASDCFEKKISSTKTEDLINGDYSFQQTININYTGLDIELEDPVPWSVEYDMSWNNSEVNEKSCGVATMNGTISAGQFQESGACGTVITKQIAAQSGYDTFVKGGEAEARMNSWFNSLKGHLTGVIDPLNPMTNLKSSQCQATVDNGSNDGSISFSFEMNNCPAKKVKSKNDKKYTSTEGLSNDYSLHEYECNGIKETQNVTSTTTDKSVQGLCGPQIDESGSYVRWDSILDIDGPDDPPYHGNYPNQWLIRSKSHSYNRYQASKQWSITFSDAPKDKECKEVTCDDDSVSGCGQFETVESTTDAAPRYIETQTSNGTMKIARGTSLPTKTVNSSLVGISTGSGCNLDVDSLLPELKDELNNAAPSCVIQNLSWNYSFDQMNETTLEGSIGGINS